MQEARAMTFHDNIRSFHRRIERRVYGKLVGMIGENFVGNT